MLKIQAHWTNAPIRGGCRREYKCSNCNCLSIHKFPYCPYCGIKMDRKYKEDEDR